MFPMSEPQSWIVVAQDGEYLISANVVVNWGRAILMIRVNQQLVVEKRSIWEPNLSGSYPLPIARHSAVLGVKLHPFGWKLSPEYRLVADSVEIPAGQR